MRIAVWVVAILLICGACRPSASPNTQPQRAEAPSPPGEEAAVLLRSEAIRSSKVPGGSAQGVVVDAETGAPISDARVSVRVLGEGEQHRAATDSAGRFSLSGLPARLAILRAEYIGRYPEEIRLKVASEVGHAVRFALRESPVCLCVDLLDPRAVTVAVRDVVTRGPPDSEATLSLRDGSYADVVAGRASPEDSVLVLRSTSWRRGIYHVEVSADGYLPWSRDSVVVATGGCCGNLQPQSIRVWLLPE